MTKRIFKSIFAVSLIVLATCTGVTLGILYHYFGNQLQKELKTEAAYLAIAVERDGIDALEALPAQAERVTYIDEDGTVLLTMWQTRNPWRTMPKEKKSKKRRKRAPARLCGIRIHFPGRLCTMP